MKRKHMLIAVLTAILNFSFVFSAYAVEANPTQRNEDIFTYIISGKTATITNVADIQQSVTIPEKLGNYTVTALDKGAFGGSTTIEEIILPDTITSIAPLCFAYSTELKSVRLPNSLTKIEAGLFSQCTKLRNIEIPSSVEIIENDAFYRCDELWTITLPEGLKTIGDNAFAACPNLSAATIPSSVTHIATNAFSPAGGFRIYAKTGTTAEQYAKNNDITFEELITIDVNGEPVVFDQPPITDTKNFRTLAPMRAILTPLGANFIWDNDLSIARIRLNGNRISIKIGDPFMMLDGNFHYLSTPAIEFNSRTLLPIRDIVESIGGSVKWNESQKHVSITCNIE